MQISLTAPEKLSIYIFAMKFWLEVFALKKILNKERGLVLFECIVNAIIFPTPTSVA